MLSLYMVQFLGGREGMTSGPFAKVRKYWRHQAGTISLPAATGASLANMRTSGLAAGDPMHKSEKFLVVK